MGILVNIIVPNISCALGAHRLSNMKTPSLFIVAGLLVSMSTSAQGLMCYSCTGRDNDGCMTNPEIAARRVSCSSGLCSIVRNKKFDGSGSQVTLIRDCHSSVSASSASSSSGNGGASSFAQTCSTDLCNSGDGRGFINMPMPGVNIHQDMPGFNYNQDGFQGTPYTKTKNGGRNIAHTASAGNFAACTALLYLMTYLFGFIGQ